jgi:mono/diheme cytochrome c family protein
MSGFNETTSIKSIGIMITSIDKRLTFKNVLRFQFLLIFFVFIGILHLSGCQEINRNGHWDYEIAFKDNKVMGVLKLEDSEECCSGTFISYDWGTIDLGKVVIEKGLLSASFELSGKPAYLNGTFKADEFSGLLKIDNETFDFTAIKQSEVPISIDRSHLSYTLAKSDLPITEENIDHAGMIGSADRETLKRGKRIYSSNCVNCHGTREVEGSIPSSLKFWEQPFKGGSDSFSMYQTLTLGLGFMPPQPTLNPQEKYDVIAYIREEFVKENKQEIFIPNTRGYLTGLPKGTSRGPETKPYQPWADMDYGDFLINTYELADETTGIPRYHSPGPAPFPDEDYRDNNFAYKGIAVRLDKGQGGISKGKAWMLFDHDLMRVAGGWTGEGFIDWNGILLNDKHETYPRTIGHLQFETPVGPGWANPNSGTFEDPRSRARDGRAFGPLPKTWADYKGLYYYEDHIIISYSVGGSGVLEELDMETSANQTVFTRTLNIEPSSSFLKMKIAPSTTKVALIGTGARLLEEDGYHMLLVDKQKAAYLKLFIAKPSFPDLQTLAETSPTPEQLKQYTLGGRTHYPEELTSVITLGSDDGPFAVDQLTPPFENPWASRMKLSGIDFLTDPNKAVVCTTDGDIWLIKGLTENALTLTWKRIGSGLFQPLGIKVIKDEIYVICRDQLVRLHDFNGDDETDFYESFNHDHQVTDHFHEFAMGLQADAEGNLYYAKSGRHAREALVPQHGTLLKVSKEGAKTEIIAKGFRAANGVCINPDGSFLVTDQQGYWNPMNRINWISGKKQFYGNMWGYDPPKDSTSTAMQQPMVWVDMEFDRSPSELVWVDSKKWGPLNGGLLSFSYGYGKIQLVLHEKINGQMQGGVIDLPGIKFLTGIMRGRFNPGDGELYACGMSAWGTNQMLRGGGLYRVRYTGKTLTVPLALNIGKNSITLKFGQKLDPSRALNIGNYTLKTWGLVRSSAYGSDRYNKKTLAISKAERTADGMGISLFVKDLQSTNVMTIDYKIADLKGNVLKGTVQNTVYQLGKE